MQAKQTFLYKQEGRNYFTAGTADEVLSFDNRTGIKTIRFGAAILSIKFGCINNIRHWFVVEHANLSEVKKSRADELLESDESLPIR